MAISTAPPTPKVTSWPPLVPVKASPVGVAETGLTDGVPTGSSVAAAEPEGAGADGLGTVPAGAEGLDLVGLLAGVEELPLGDGLGELPGDDGPLGLAGAGAEGEGGGGVEELGDGLGELGALLLLDGLGAGGVGVTWQALPPFHAEIRLSGKTPVGYLGSGPLIPSYLVAPL
jgi:hypothetical protein